MTNPGATTEHPDTASAQADANTPVLSVRDLQTYFFTDAGVAKAVDGVSFDLYRGRTLALVGESGCGKSMSALSILRLVPDPPGRIVGGQILFHGQDLTQISNPQMRALRGNQISMIFQEPMTSLNPVFRIGGQIASIIMLHKGVDKKEAREQAIALLGKVGIPSPEERIDDYPHQMSGGMRQRVMIAMALACDPDVLIADEPTTALDVTIQAQILALLRRLQDEVGMALLLITHDLGIVAENADEVAIMYAGRIVEQAPVQQLFSQPKHPYTVGLFNSLPKLDQGGSRLEPIRGTVPNSAQFPPGCRFHPRCPHAMEVCRERTPEFLPVETDHVAACWLHDAGVMSAQGRRTGLPNESESG